MSGLEIDIARSDLHFEVDNDLLIIKVKKGVGESSSTLSPYYLSALKIQIDTLKRSEQELLPHPIQSYADEMLRCRNIVDREYLKAENVLSSAHSWEDIAIQQAISDVRQSIVEYNAAIDKARKGYIQEGYNSSGVTSILASFQSQLKMLRLQAEELKRNPLLVDIVRVALTEADQRAQEALDALREFFATHHTIDSDAQEKIVDVEDALAYYGKVIFIAQKSLTDKLTDQMLQQLNVVSQENNTTALGYATAAQQAAFEASQNYTNLTAITIDQSITAAQSLEVFIRSSEGILLQQEPTSTMSVGVRLNGKDITNQVLSMVPAVNFVWHRKSKTGTHEGMTDAEWDAYALGRHEVTIKRAFKHKLRFWLETSKEDDDRIIEQFKHKRI